jgi:hypothetical protein
MQGGLDRYRWALALERLKVSNETVKAVADGIGWAGTIARWIVLYNHPSVQSSAHVKIVVVGGEPKNLEVSYEKKDKGDGIITYS